MNRSATYVKPSHSLKMVILRAHIILGTNITVQFKPKINPINVT